MARPSAAAIDEDDVDRDPHIRRMARSGALSMAGAAVSAVAGVVLVATITRGLTKSEAGAVFTTTSLFLVAMSVVQLGADVGVVRWLPAQFALGRRHEVTATLRAALVPVVVLSVAVAVGVVVLAPDVADLFSGGQDLDVAGQLRVLALFLPIGALFNVLLAATRAFRTMRPTVVVDALGRSLLQLGLVALATTMGLGTIAVVSAWALPYAVAVIAAGAWLVLLLRRSSARAADADEPADRRRVRRQFWAYTSPRAVATIAQAMLKRSDIVLVAALASPAQAALYAAATRFVVFGQLAVQALQQALAPMMSATLAREDHDRAQDVYRTTTTWAMALAWPVYLASAVLASWLLTLFGQSYSTAAPVVVILSLAMLVATASGSVDTVLLMAGRSWLSLLNTGIALVINVGMNLVLIPKIGIVGAALSWAVAIVVRNALPLAMINRMLGMSPFGPGAAWVAGSSVLCIAVAPTALLLLGAPTGVVVVSTVLGGLAYLAALWAGRDRIQLSAFRSVLIRGRGKHAQRGR